MTQKCSATTKSGKSCSRNAKDGSSYCAQHSAMESVTEAVTSTAANVTAAVAPEKSEEEAIKEALGELHERVDEIKSKGTKFSPSDYSPEKLFEWIKENINNFNLPVIEELTAKLKGASADDFKNPETWKEIWVIVSHAIQEEVSGAMSKAEEAISPAMDKAKERLDGMPTLGEARQQFEDISAVKDTKAFVEGLPGVKEGIDLLNQVPGAATVNSLGQALEKTAPKDFLDAKTWEGFWKVVNHSLSAEIKALRGEVEEEIIDVTESSSD